MAFDFPAAPNTGDTFLDPSTGASYRWNGYAWIGGGAAASNPIVSVTPPSNPADNSFWWESDTGYLFLRYNDGNSAQWVQVNALPNGAGYVSKLGDSMTGGLTITKPWAATGDEALIIAPSTGGAYIDLNRAAGQGAAIYGRTGTSPRWGVIVASGGAESGGNAGSDFSIQRYSDAGAYLDSPLTISRTNATATFSASITASATITGTTLKANSVCYFSATNAANFYANSTTTTSAINFAGSGVYAFNYIIATGMLTWIGNSAQVMTLDYTGNFTIANQGLKPGGGSWAASSDARIKTVQHDYESGLAEILALRPVVYTYNGNDKNNEHGNSLHKQAAEAQTPFVGLVAQEAELVLPGIVSQQAGWIDDEAVDDLRIIDTSELTYTLINAVKDLNQQIIDLKAEIATLRGAR
jgi:Chaperone of endosialidase